MSVNFSEIAKREQALKEVKHLIELNGVRYYTQEEHQKFLDNVDLDSHPYRPQRDDKTGEVVHNGATRVVVDDKKVFSMPYYFDEDTKKVHVVTGDTLTNQIAIYALQNNLELNIRHVKTYMFSYNVVGNSKNPNLNKREINLDSMNVVNIPVEQFVNKFGSDLYEEDQELALKLIGKIYKSVAAGDKSSSAKRFSIND